MSQQGERVRWTTKRGGEEAICQVSTRGPRTGSDGRRKWGGESSLEGVNAMDRDCGWLIRRMHQERWWAHCQLANSYNPLGKKMRPNKKCDSCQSSSPLSLFICEDERPLFLCMPPRLLSSPLLAVLPLNLSSDSGQEETGSNGSLSVYLSLDVKGEVDTECASILFRAVEWFSQQDGKSHTFKRFGRWIEFVVLIVALHF